MVRSIGVAVGVVAFLASFGLRVASQSPPQAPRPGDDPPAGIPITDPTVKRVCGDCHPSDAEGRMSRISYRRTTPEGWQETIRRMATLNQAPIEPADARVVVKYLADTLGLAPDEARPGAFEVERRLIDWTYEGDKDTAQLCSSCHSMGRVVLQRRTGEEWDLLVAMHRGWYPLADFQGFRRFGPPSREPGPDGRPPDNRHPMDKALGHLKGAFPFTTKSWTDWAATMRSPQLAGTWVVGGYEIGEGPFYGRMTVAAGAAPDEFTTNIAYMYPKSGRTVSRTGRSVIYTGFQWRGRSQVGTEESTSLREVMLVERDWQSMSGRWFTGAYDELGVDVTLRRVGAGPVVAGLDRPALRTGAIGQRVRVFGEGLPASLVPGDVDFGRGITIARVVSATPTEAVLEVTVAPDAPQGVRDLYLAGTFARAALVVYPQVDQIKVTPAWGMARVGGVMYPKMFARFEATAFADGPDGKPDTADDLNLGAVDAVWTLEEYTATYADDDLKFVGEIDGTRGVFSPAQDGPNPARSGNRNNIGDVWVIATHTPAAGEPLRARAHLVVTVPLYMRWDFATLEGRR
ncbi:MAG TPA: quinohemoprotein amine dehydrogenase subunit alpha [Vicinamibacterales bacterium]|nr:quinohemoprotein amine dehydrogenase subunit alpha [Vicinamibacterales bacterium]